MSTFNPDAACRVHDQLNDRVLDWRPEWAAHYRQYASEHDAGVIGWGRAAAGRLDLVTMPRKPIEIPPAAAKAFVKDMRAFHAAKTGFDDEGSGVKAAH